MLFTLSDELADLWAAACQVDAYAPTSTKPTRADPSISTSYPTPSMPQPAATRPRC
ncbi:MAG: hypothetical protein ACRDYX_05230 [Egibacteraceae bacterium]